MKNPLKQDSRRIIWFLLLATVLGHDAHAQQNTITGYNQIVGQWDASQAARTNVSRTGTGSPVGRDQCNRPGESFFQTDAAAGQNNWYCTVAGSPGTWVIGVGPVAVGASLPATCAVGQQYFVTTSGATYGLNVCIATNTWTAQSGASDSGTVTSVSASCAHGPNAVDDAHVPMTWGKSVSSPRQWPRLASLWRSRLDTLATVSRAT
jgi:hypothetical protein